MKSKVITTCKDQEKNVSGLASKKLTNADEKYPLPVSRDVFEQRTKAWGDTTDIFDVTI